jgi:UDP:flavonoid glycosyltransferase YjiC (YdhE family)
VRRGHAVQLETWSRWREDVEREGMRFAASDEHAAFSADGHWLKPYQAAVRAAQATAPVLAEFDPDVVVVDVLTTAAALSAEMNGRPWATLIPHVLPTPGPGFPPYSIGARLPRTFLGRALWNAMDPLVQSGQRQGRDEINGARERVGLRQLRYLHNGLSRRLTIAATFPQLEYPRPSPPPWVETTGPLLWERRYGEVELPPGDAPLVLIAPSTAQDPEQRMLAAALEGLAGAPVRVLATYNRRPPPRPLHVPPNARLVEWLSYERTMPRCAAVICHAGHGTLVRALACGVPVVACPAAGDMAENAARVNWAGVGVSLPRRLGTPRGIRLAVERVLSEPRLGERARELRDWAQRHDGAERAARAVEALAAREALTRAAPGASTRA